MEKPSKSLKFKYSVDTNEWYPVYSINIITRGRDNKFSNKPINFNEDNSDLINVCLTNEKDYGLEFTEAEEKFIQDAFHQFSEAQELIRLKRIIHNEEYELQEIEEAENEYYRKIN